MELISKYKKYKNKNISTAFLLTKVGYDLSFVTSILLGYSK